MVSIIFSMVSGFRTLVAATKILKPETIEKMIEEMFAGPKAKFIPLNIEAFRRGMACVQ